MQDHHAESQANRQMVYGLLMHVPACIAVVLGPDHTFVFANARFLQAFGQSTADALLGRSVRVALPQLEEGGHLALLDRVYTTGRSQTCAEALVKTARRGDGTYDAGFFDLTLQPTRRADGAVDGVLIHAVEVTETVRERQRIEQLAQQLARERQFVAALLELQRKHDALLDVAPDCLFLVGPLGRFVYVNRAAADIISATATGAGRSAQDILGRSSRELGLPEEFVARFEAQQARALKGEFLPKDVALRRAGRMRTFQLFLRPLYREDGTIEALAGVARDVEEERQKEIAMAHARAENASRFQAAQEQAAAQRQRSAELTATAEEQTALRRHAEERMAALEDLARQKDEFIAVASHELKSPLTTIRGYAQLLLRRVRGPKPDLSRIEEGLAVINEEIGAMTWLLDDLLDASRIQMGTLELRAAPCEFGECLTAVLARLNPEEQARVEVILDDAPLAGIWERKKIEQALANLVGNALKYSPGGSRSG